MASSSNLKYFRKGENLTKDYNIQKMIGNQNYADYVFDKTSSKFQGIIY